MMARRVAMVATPFRGNMNKKCQHAVFGPEWQVFTAETRLRTEAVANNIKTQLYRAIKLSRKAKWRDFPPRRPAVYALGALLLASFSGVRP
jgi:hypothetical protein